MQWESRLAATERFGWARRQRAARPSGYAFGDGQTFQRILWVSGRLAYEQNE